MSIAKQYTGEANESDAIRKFRKVLTSREMFHNKEKFPANESGDIAFLKCTSPDSARRFCPQRFKAMKGWIDATKKVLILCDLSAVIAVQRELQPDKGTMSQNRAYFRMEKVSTMGQFTAHLLGLLVCCKGGFFIGFQGLRGNVHQAL